MKIVAVVPDLFFRGKIESEIEGYLDALLASRATKKPAAKARPAAKKK